MDVIKMLSLETPNQIGESKKIDKIEEKVEELKGNWDLIATIEKSGWFDWKPRVNLYKLTNFLLIAVDELINVIDEFVLEGKDKKATVLSSIEKLYDYATKEALPIWLIPFSNHVKTYIIYTLISTSIDWIVTKYRNGEWRDNITPNH